MENYSGTLRITNPETLQKWIDSGKYQQLINDGYIYAEGCGRFRKEICTCAKCRKKRNEKSRIEKLEAYLNRINSIMWNTWGIKDKDYGRLEGEQIMEVLNDWASS